MWDKNSGGADGEETRAKRKHVDEGGHGGIKVVLIADKAIQKSTLVEIEISTVGSPLKKMAGNLQECMKWNKTERERQRGKERERGERERERGERI